MLDACHRRIIATTGAPSARQAREVALAPIYPGVWLNGCDSCRDTGFVTAGELAAVLEEIGWHADRKTAASMLEEADLDHDGKVTLSEFLTMMAAADPDPKDELLHAFRTFDKDGSGFITTAEFQETMEVQGHKRMSMKTVESIVAEADTNKDGKIDYNEFVAAMT